MYRKLPEGTEELIKKELQDGKTYREIEKAHGINMMCIYRIKKKLGMEKQKTRKPAEKIERVKFERQISHYRFSGAHQNDTFICSAF